MVRACPALQIMLPGPVYANLDDQFMLQFKAFLQIVSKTARRIARRASSMKVTSSLRNTWIATPYPCQQTSQNP